MGQGVIQRELEGVTLGSPVGIFESDPAWEELGRGMRAVLYSALRGERIFSRSVLDRTVYCGILSAKVYKVGIRAPQAYGHSLLAAFSRRYGTPNTESQGRRIWDDGVTRLEWWTDMPVDQVSVFLTDYQLVTNGYGRKPWFRVFLALMKAHFMRLLTQILVRLPFPRVGAATSKILPDWLRWTLVLPAAIGAFIGVHIVVIVGTRFLSGPFWEWFCQLINSVAAPYCFVLAGAKTAPRNRVVAAVALVVVWTLFTGGVMTLAIVEQRMDSYKAVHSDPFWWLIVASVIGIAASIAACIQVHKGEPVSPR